MAARKTKRKTQPPPRQQPEAPRIRKPIVDIINELKSWLPNYSREQEYPTLLLRILASLQGGDQLEDAGYEPISGIGWHEADQLGRTLEAIKDKRDVEDIARELLSDNEEEPEEAPARGSAPPPFQPSAKRGTTREPGRVEASRTKRVQWNQTQDGNAHVSDGQEGYWAHFPRGTSAKRVLDTFLATADYDNSTAEFTVTATIAGNVASARIGPGGERVSEAGHGRHHGPRSTRSPVRRSLHGRKSQPPRRRR